MEVFNAETASLADLWAAHLYLKKEIKFFKKMLKIGQPLDGTAEMIGDLIDADGDVKHEIMRRMDAFIQPKIKA